jgi:glucose/arabinose dehydrogenase
MPRTALSLTPLEDRLTPVVLPDGFTLTSFITGLSKPTALELLPDGRFLIAEQNGALRIASSNGSSVATALTLAVDSAGERGLLGVAIDPNFAANGFVYLYHTVPDGGTAAHNRLSRFTLVGDTIAAGSEQILVDLEPLDPARTNHNGGALHFGTDGKLYVAVGENANAALAQSPTSRFGKILRYNPDGSIPSDNPTTIAGVAGTPQGDFAAIFAAGLRNPFTFDVDRATGRIYVNDVGANAFEEVNELAPGRNFGWPMTEGDFDAAAFPNFTRPLVAYAHGAGTDKGFAVTGGAFYRPALRTFPLPMTGDYFYADFINGWIRSVDSQTGATSLFASELDGFRIVDLDVAPDGALLVLDRGADQVARIQAFLPVPGPGGPPQTPPPPPTYAIGSGNSPNVRVIDAAGDNELDNVDLNELPFYPEFTGDARVVTADLEGDQSREIVVGSGPGSPPRISIFRWGTRELISSVEVFESSFTGGVFVTAGDVDGDGKDEIIVSPDQGGGPRVKIFRNGDLHTVAADFFGIEDPNFRGGARVGVGDLNGDAKADVIVSAGFLGGPRVAGYDAVSVLNGNPSRLFNDFFAFEETLRNGTFVAVRDIDFDGIADLAVAAGPDGGPRIQIFSGAGLVQDNSLNVLSNFFAGDPNQRGGTRIGFVNDSTSLLVGTAPGTVGRVLIYDFDSFSPPISPEPDRTLTPFGDQFMSGVFVG